MEEVKKDDLQGTIKEFDKAIELDPNFAKAILYRARAKTSMEDFKEAIPDYNKIIQLSPDSTDAYLGRGICWYNLGYIQAGCKDFTKAQELGGLELKIL